MYVSKDCNWTSFETKDIISIRRKSGHGFHNSSKKDWLICFWWHRPATHIAEPAVNIGNMEVLVHYEISTSHMGILG
jgi:oxalate decarboxylase/phosphoglucose isomerase-like protein (cupin superfamily)